MVPSLTLALNSMVNTVSGFFPIFPMTGRSPSLERKIIIRDENEDGDDMDQAWGVTETMEKCSKQ